MFNSFNILYGQGFLFLQNHIFLGEIMYKVNRISFKTIILSLYFWNKD